MVGGTDQGQLQTQQHQLHVGRDDTTSVMLTESEFFPDGGSKVHAYALYSFWAQFSVPGGGADLSPPSKWTVCIH